MESELDPGSFDSLVKIIARLRSPDGCPWDRAQTHASLRPSLMEECYEAMEALDKGDLQELKGELGDLLLQVVLHAQIASENGDFDIRGVIKSINEKLIYRHPHIFGNARVNDAGEVAIQWEALKKRERNCEASLLSGVPKALPGLAYSHEVQERAARVGFDWKDVEGVLEKLTEEIREIQKEKDSQKKAGEFGDLLFTLVNLARHLGIDAEAALRGANRRFYERFSYMEKACARKGVELASLSLDEQNTLWEEAKKAIG
jgi:tetrapyrrole methylase family protein/MazG family protein